MSNTTQLPKSRQLRLNIRMSLQEWDKVHKLATNSTCRSVSEYARKVLAEKPVKVFYRNQSFDNFEEQMTRLLPQLESCADNFAILVKKLSSMESMPEIRSALSLVLTCEKDFARKMDTIKGHIENLSDLCAQK
jgi:hypothetical protein